MGRIDREGLPDADAALAQDVDKAIGLGAQVAIAVGAG